ncbi:MAG: hypothetical protein QMC36_09340 [Patescibacteria group bacterium]
MDVVGVGDFGRTLEIEQRSEIGENLVPVVREEFFGERFRHAPNVSDQKRAPLFFQRFGNVRRSDFFQTSETACENLQIFAEIALFEKGFVSVMPAFM